MTSRYRFKELSKIPTGYAQRLSSQSRSPDGVWVNSSTEVWDHVQSGDGHPFDVQIKRHLGGVINHHPHLSARRFYNYLAEYMFNADLRSHLDCGSPSDGEVATFVIKKTNPSRPEVDLPIFIAELKDIPQLIKTGGDKLLRKKQFLRRGAQANLEYQFGWKPFIDDLFTLFTFQDEVDNRVKELQALGSSGLRRTRDIGNYSATQEKTVAYQSLFAFFGGPVQRVTTEAVKGHVKWYPSDNGWPNTPAAMRSLARRAALGWTLDASTAWELIPWSWLIDWCSNTGDYLQTFRNIVPAWHTPVEVMRHKVSMLTSPECRNDWGVMTPINSYYETKYRRTAIPSLTAQLPFLNKRQLSILGSIGVLRSSRRAR